MGKPKLCNSSAQKLQVNSCVTDPYYQKPEETLPKLHRAVEQSAELVVIADRSGRMEYMNPAFEILTGYSSTEAIGQRLAIVDPGQQEGRGDREFWNAVVSGKVFRGVFILRNKNGDKFTSEMTLTPLRNEEGAITHFICKGPAAGDQPRMQSEWQQSQKLDAIERLVGGIAHDFNNLLLIISAYAELMLDSLVPDHPLRHNANEIINASRRGADLSRQLLTFCRKQAQSLQVIDLSQG